ncbi:MAG: DUF4271 domain-containing protein [Butyricimonas faecalis]
MSFLLDLVYIVDFFNGSSLCILSCFNLFPDHFRLLLFSFGTCATFGWTFNGRHCASEIILNLCTSANVVGLSISPFVLALFYVQAVAVDMLLYVILGIGIIILIFRFIRLIKILYGYRVSILYMILYLCGFEILPILVLYKLLG